MKNQIHLHKISTLPNLKLSKAQSKTEMIKLTNKLAQIQDKLYAQNKYAILILLQGMDTAGKDSAVKHVFSGVNPAGCNVKSFKAPSTQENSHHFLWRISKECPAKGMMKIFNRSQYEDILVPMINHKMSKEMLIERCKEINAFEKGLMNDHTIYLKFYLHISHDEQLIRLEERRTNPNKNWKYQSEDVKDIERHNQFKSAYEFIFTNCSEEAKWNIIPSDKKWFKNYLILKTIVDRLEKYEINYPKLIE
jgi:PPK2 family polyphosphate:nucleotide phosphotransferase